MATLISVVMPVRDGERFLAEAVDSVLGQSHRDLELVVVDDGSTDRTPELLEAFRARDDRVRVVRQAAANIACALNAGIAAARGASIARMDADDVAEPDRLARELDVLAADPACVLVATAAVLIDGRGRSFETVGPPRTHEAIAAGLRAGNVLVHGSVMFRRSAWESAGGYDERAHDGEDYDLWCRLLAAGRIAGLGTPLYRLRIHGDSFTARRVERQLEATYRIRERHFGTPRPTARGRRTALADRHLVYARRLAAAGESSAAGRHLAAAWRVKPWSPTVARCTVAWLRGATPARSTA